MFNKLLLTLFIFKLTLSLSNATYLSLNGNQWTAINHNKSIKAKATVPGTIYSDLRNDGILKQDLYYENNDINYNWVSKDNWTYERTFEVDEALLNNDGVYLVAEGIDTVSSVYINDKLIGSTDNMFVRYKFDVKHVAKTGQNSVRLVFVDADDYAKQQADIYHKDKSNYPVVPTGKNFIRKMQSSFGWDWGPSFPTQGIWKSIGIEAYNLAILRDITVETIPDAKNSSNWTLSITAHLETTFKTEKDSYFSIDLNEHKLVENQKQILKPESDNTVKVKFIIPINKIKITPWFPNGVADNTQTLYKLNISVGFPDRKDVSTKSVRFGFKKIELIQEPIKPDGLTFYFKINGKPFYSKGSNWIPANILQESITRDYLRNLLESVKEANMNMLRVWGGGVYESDYFYELADELGILIWQDFMFACNLYPTDANYLKSVDSEITQQVRRLQSHPSIAIWAGNNENEQVIAAFWYYKPEREGYKELFINHIKKIVDREDNTRPYVSSSPSNGLMTEKEDWTPKNPNDLRYGDVHYYNDGGKLWDWRTYPSAKFVSEYGFQSYPSLETLSQVINENEFAFPVSKAVEHRQRHPGGTHAIEWQISNYYNLPSHGGSDRFNDLIYLSQIIQSIAMKTETEFYRRNREIDSKTGNGHTMGALYWQLNDIWEGQSWASIEFGGKWKLLQNFAKKFFDNQLISPFEDSNEMLKISFIRDDYLGELVFNLSVKVYKWQSIKAIHEIKSEVKTNSFSSNIVYTHSIPDLLKQSNCGNRSECLVFVEIENLEHKLRADNYFLLTEPKHSMIVKPNLKLIDVKSSGRDPYRNLYYYTIDLSSESVTPFVYLEFKLKSGINGHFSDNGFFIFNNQKSVEFISHSNITIQHIKDSLTLKSLTDVK